MTGLLFFILFWVVLPIALIMLLAGKKKTGATTLDSGIAQRDNQWMEYLASFRAVVKTEAEKRLLETLLAGKTINDLYPSAASKQAAKQDAGAVAAAEIPAVPVISAAPYTAHETAQPVAPRQQLDNTILLLYFGAFLLVASVGLFVAVGGLGGVARTIIVGLTAGILYYGGLRLYETNKKLAQAGISFVGSGMIIAPLTGVAWYNLVAEQSQAGAVWLITSLVSAALYYHAYRRIQNGFVSYLLIGSFVSSIESAVLTIDLPAYGYAWGLILAGLALLFFRRQQGREVSLDQASDVSSQLLIPLSVIGSLVLLPEFGSLQLAVTLVLSGMYYTLQAIWNEVQRTNYSLAAQAAYISAAASFTYQLEQTWIAVGVTLLVIAFGYLAASIVMNLLAVKRHVVFELGAVVAVLGAGAVIPEPWLLVTAIILLIAMALTGWLRLSSDAALQSAGALLIGLPFVTALYALDRAVGSGLQLGLSSAAAVLLLVLVLACSRNERRKPYYASATVLYLLAIVALLVPAWLHGFPALMTVILLAVASFVYVRYRADDHHWLVCVSVLLFVPIIHALLVLGSDSREFSVAVGVALLGNICVSLATRQAATRWLTVVCILLAPVALGGGGLGFHWGIRGYTGGYLLAMAACILARAIARGRYLVSSKVPIASYYAAASEAYIAGYFVAAFIALVLSLQSPNSQQLTTGVLLIISAAVIVLARVEKSHHLLALLPVLIQGVLLSAMRPELSDASEMGLFALASTLLATIAYGLTHALTEHGVDAARQSILLTSVGTAFIGPATGLGQSEPSLLLPASLFIAGLLTYHYNRNSAVQSTKELSVAISLAAVHWLVYLLGYTNIHVHTHLLGAFLGGFAVWRRSSGDITGGITYIQAAYAVITVPLALAAMGDENGSTYGMMLIAEQVGFMLLGVSIKVRFLVQAGLWTGLAAILYQLRGLGWAFLSLLAIIVIGIAVYRLQKHPPDNQ
jgi:hypothetical protein